MSWEKVKLGDLITITKGKKHSETDDDTFNRYLQIEDLNGQFTKKYTREKGTYVNEKDIVIVWDGANAGKVGCNMKGVIGSTLARLSFKENNIETEFVKRYLDHKFEFIKSQRTGATIPHVSGEALKGLIIPLPPLSTQQKIAAILDKADGLHRKDKQLLAKYESLLRSIFYKMFEADTNSFTEVQLETLFNKSKNAARTGPFGSDLLHSEFVNSGITVLGIDNVVNNFFEQGKERFINREKYETLRRYTVYPKDVLITIMGTTGRSAVVPESIPLAINTKHLAAITFDTRLVNPYFISYYIHSSHHALQQMKLRNRGAIMDGLNLGIVKELRIKLPSIELQNRFGQIQMNIMLQKAKIIAQLAKSETLFKGLLQKAFKGELVTD